MLNDAIEFHRSDQISLFHHLTLGFFALLPFVFERYDVEALSH